MDLNIRLYGDVLITSARDILKTPVEDALRTLQWDVLRTSVKDVLRTSVGDVPWRYIEDHMRTSIELLLGTSPGRPRDVILLSGSGITI